MLLDKYKVCNNGAQKKKKWRKNQAPSNSKCTQFTLKYITGYIIILEQESKMPYRGVSVDKCDPVMSAQ